MRHGNARRLSARKLLLLALTALAVAGPVLAPSGGASGLSGRSIALTFHLCPTLNYSHLSARDSTTPIPTFSMASGDKLSSSYQVRIITTTLSPINVAVHVPALLTKFPQAYGPYLPLPLPAHLFTLTTLGWTKASLTTTQLTLNASASFSSTLPAEITSQLVGVSANVSYGNITLAFRWFWSATFASNATTVNGPFSKMGRGGSDPAIFDPAPYVSLVSTSNATAAPIGTNFIANLAGAVVDTRFISELEYATNGKVVQISTLDTNPNTTAPVALGVPILSRGTTLGPAGMLNHVRNICGILLYSIPVQTVYDHNVSVHLFASPAACGPITFNGSSYPSGASAIINASAASVPISVPSCSGHAFHIWTYTRGVYLGVTYRNVTSAVISAGGNLTAKFF
ncbi:MAG: hypothetical protein L3K09_02920 [Thermoplasmata archaeon]|nr:hypothetical protein [Thermoplasmata archaeon]